MRFRWVNNSSRQKRIDQKCNSTVITGKVVTMEMRVRTNHERGPLLETIKISERERQIAVLPLRLLGSNTAD